MVNIYTLTPAAIQQQRKGVPAKFSVRAEVRPWFPTKAGTSPQRHQAK